MNPTSEEMRGPRLKIERANTHIIEARTAIRNFFDNNPDLISVFTEVEPDGVQESLKFRLEKCTPDTLIPIVGDAIGNLRSALDHVAGQLALKAGAANTKFVSYPFAGSREEFEGARTKEKIKKLSPEAQAFLLGLETYKGGKGASLWAMNEMRQLDFHNGIVPIATATSSVSAHINILPGIGRRTISGPRWVRFDEQMTATVLSYPAGSKGQGEFNASFDVAFGNVEMFEGEPVLVVLEQFSDLTTRVVTLVEDRFFKP